MHIFGEVMQLIVVRMMEDGLTVDGHAGYAKTGNDIVCAAVSALAQGLAHSMKALTEDQVTFWVRDGHMKIQDKDPSEQAKLLIDSFFISVSDIQATYGKEYVEIYTEPDGRKTE